ncbi:MAG: cytochrome c biogenesis CcdA family protein [Lachnospiraceae bacterium]
MNIESLYINTVFIAGILSFLSPCIIPLLPVYFSTFGNEEILNAQKEQKFSLRIYLVLRTLLFVAGVACCFVILGFGAGFLGNLINSDIFLKIMGAIVIIMGLHQTGLIKIKKLYSQKKVDLGRAQKKDALGIFLLGFTFSFGWTPCIGPVLAAILGLSAGSSTAMYGALLMAVYSLGFAIPFIILALFSEILLRKTKLLNRHLGKIKIISGLVIILMGIFLMTNNLNIFVAWIGGF